jgi:hypothetical protein
MILAGENRRTRRKTCPSVTLSTTNPTWIDLDAKPGLGGERPATNRLSHGLDNIKIDLKYRVWTGFNWLKKRCSEWLDPMNTTMNLRVLKW